MMNVISKALSFVSIIYTVATSPSQELPHAARSQIPVPRSVALPCQATAIEDVVNGATHATHLADSAPPPLAAGDKAAATKEFQAQQGVIDRIADKKIVHKNMAARSKHRLAHALKAMP